MSASSPPTPTETAPTRAPSKSCSRSRTPPRAITTAVSSQFGPDGDLYISVGDGGGANDTEMNAQHTTTLLGKVLRISPEANGQYSIPAGNPFNTGQSNCSSGPRASTTMPACPEIWAYGLRNPWRFSFDSATGDMVIGDVGQSAEEEIDFAHPGQNVGANYGWPC